MLTPQCLRSIRAYLPSSEIILSTWEGSKIDGLDYDALILNMDPGGKKHDFYYGTLNNTNRQLISTQGGLRKASRPYCLKLRTDALLRGDTFLKYWEMFPILNTDYSIFDHKILAGTVYSREVSCSGGTKLPTPFHPSDIWLMGSTSDLQRYFLDTELMPDKDLALFPYKYPNRTPYITPSWRYAPEQYFLISYLRRLSGIHFSFDDWSDWSPDNIELSQNILYNNFIFLGLAQSGIYNPKHAQEHKYDDKIHGIITYDIFQRRYKEFCDPNFLPDASNENRLRIRRCKHKIQRSAAVLLAPAKAITSWLNAAIKIAFQFIKLIYLFLQQKV